MDKNTIIGLTLIFALVIAWQQLVIGPQSKKRIAEQKRIQDSIALVERRADSLAQIQQKDTTTIKTVSTPAVSDSAQQQSLLSKYGPFAAAAQGKEAFFTLENDVFILKFSNKGGRIVDAELKNFAKISENEKKKEIESPLRLLEDAKDKFEYLLPVRGAGGGVVPTGALYFTVSEKTANSITLRASVGEGQFFEQKYTIQAGTYNISYDLTFEGLESVLTEKVVELSWLNYLDKLEKNTKYERTYSSVYYKPLDDRYSYISYTADDTEDLSGTPLKWISHSNQFFNASLVAKNSFSGAVMEAKQLDEKNEDLKRLYSKIKIPYNQSARETFSMNFYVGPNEFNRLRAMGDNLEDVIPFGWSIFGTINRWVIRPIFNFLESFIGSQGIVILFLTLIVKLLLYPLTYRMLYSQSKMGALKPQLETLKMKFKDDPQQVQVETMKIYRENGVNPLGGCMPMLLQMPIWFALYRFFPAAIEFRQASFLWATDLSSYDVFMRLPFEIPLGFGSHISLFTLLWAATTLIYTYYSTRHMDMSANPAMKYMQYIMPVMFLGFFNSFASGLTCYLLFSNIINIAQTLITKNFIIDENKIHRELEAYRQKPKKKGGFQERLETALKEQQKLQAQRQREQAKKSKDKK